MFRPGRLGVCAKDLCVIIATPADQMLLSTTIVERFGEDLLALLNGVEYPQILINFERVVHLSSAAFGKLLTPQRAINTIPGARLMLYCISEDVLEIFVTTKLKAHFDIQSTEEAALSRFATTNPVP